MDTNRISILKRDLSAGTTPSTETLKGFTVVKAAKGPIDPILIPAQSPSLVYEVLGYTSKEYPHIQEVLDFNKQFDVYVSAPYSQAGNSKIPVAYVTPAGIFASAEPVALEGVNLGEVNEGLDVEGINIFQEGDPTVLVPVGKEASMFATSEAALVDQKALSFANSTLSVQFGFDAHEVLVEDAKGIDVLDSASFVPGNLSRILKTAATSPTVGELVFDIPGEELIVLGLKEETGDFALYSGAQLLYSLGSISGGTDAFDIVADDLEPVSSSVVSKYFSKASFTQFWGSEEFINTVHVYWKAILNADAIKATIFPKYVSERSISMVLPSQKLGNRISFTASEPITPTTYSTKNIAGSLLNDDKDGFGATLSFAEKLADQHIVDIAVVDSFDENTIYTATQTSFSPTMPAISFRLARGVREVGDNDLEAAWNVIASDSDYEHVEVFFRPDVLEIEDDTGFFGLASKHTLSRFVANIEISPEEVGDVGQLAKGSNYFISTNSFLRRSTFTKEDYWSPLTGALAAMYLACVSERMGGVAPMYLNANGLGGQLNVSVKKAKHKYNKDQLTLLDNANFNPIVRDQSYGVMVVGQKTAQGGELSDWSYIGHASAFLAFLREARNNVMIPQLGKPNNPFYRELRQTQIDNILRPRIEGISRIWADAVADTSTAVNTTEVLQERKFAIVVKVKVDIFSEGVELTLINYAQGTEIV
jgi:hypothetical protein